MAPQRPFITTATPCDLGERVVNQVALPSPTVSPGPDGATLGARGSGVIAFPAMDAAARRPEPAPRRPSRSSIPRRRDPLQPVPLSFPQRQLWLHAQMAGDKPIYNEAILLRRSGPLDVTLLERALLEIARRHESWRTTFDIVGDTPVQVVGRPRPIPVRLVDVRAGTGRAREEECRRLVVDESRRHLDLAAGPLARVLVLRTAETTYDIWLIVHHLIVDMATVVDVLLPELIEIYTRLASGRPLDLPEPAVQYPDFAAWQHEDLTEERLQAQLAYWRRQLGGELPALDLPVDHRRAGLPGFRGAAHASVIDRETTAALKALARADRATLNMTLLAAFAVLLYRYQGHDDVVVGTLSTARKHPDLERVLGYFVNILPLRVPLAGGLTFREVLNRVRAAVLEAVSNDDVPLDRIVREIAPRRHTSGQPFFQTMFSFTTAPRLADGWTLEPDKPDTGDTVFDLLLHSMEIGGELTNRFTFDTELFDRVTIERLALHYATLLEGAARHPERRVSELPLLTEPERATMLVEWNRTARDYARDSTIQEAFERQVQQRGDAVALSFGAERVTYRQLSERASRFAAYLARRGVSRGDLVAICTERSVETIVALVGIVKAGAAYLPLDPNYPQERLAFVLDDARPRVLVTSARFAGRFAADGSVLVNLDTEAGEIAATPAASAFTRGEPLDVAYVTYTSGSTGRPKGVIIPHRGVLRLVDNPDYARFTPDEVFLQFAPFPFDLSTFEIWGALLNGARLAICPPGTPTLEELGEVIQREGVTTLWLTAPLFHRMAESNPEGLRGVRQLLAGGDVVSPDHVRRLLESGWGGVVIDGYGPTENTTFTTCYSVTSPSQVGDSVPIGRPIANTTAYVLGRDRQPVPIGVPGELYTGGDGLALGYLNRPELTAERFVPDPFSASPGARLYKTGDRVRWRPDGNLEFLGRIDRQVKIRGFRVEPEETETVLAGCPDAREVAVFAEGDASGDKRLVAYVVPVPGRHVTPGILRDFLAARLPGYMVPSAFVLLDRMPLTATGKLDRNAMAAARATAPSAGDRTAPRNATEEVLAEIWRSILGISTFGVRANFFELGGDSLRAVRLFAEIRRRFDRSLPLATLFQAPTIEHLAEALNAATAASPVQEAAGRRSPLVAIQPQGSRQPFFCVHPIGGEVLCYNPLAQLLGADQPFYGLQALDEEVEATRPSLEQLAARYVGAVRDFMPHGPYLLGGFSLGALVAFEMARQINAAGEQVALLALVDAIVAASSPPSLARVFRNAVDALPYWVLDDALSTSPRESLGRVWRKARFLGWKATRVLGGAHDSGEAELPDDVLELRFPGYRLPLVRALHDAYLRYDPQPYAGRITLFRSRARSVWSSEDPETGWRRLAAGGVDVRTIPGSHTRLLKDPGLRILARELAACLEVACPLRS